MRLSFTKMQGLGNDFIVFDAPAGTELPSAEVFRRLADRRVGIGFDQALVLMPPAQDGVDVFYRIFNADGSEVEQCGNGARCIASLVARQLGKARVQMDSPGGRVNGFLRDDGLVSVDMGVPNFRPQRCRSMLYAKPTSIRCVSAKRNCRSAPYRWAIRTPSCKYPRCGRPPWTRWGPRWRIIPAFAKRTNVGFMEVVGPTHIRLRVFERGVGETQACGTGACAAVAVGRRWGLLQEEVQVDAPGGRMIVRWPGPGEALWLTGPAVTVFEGTVEV